MKFGGTSVGTPEAIQRTAHIIQTARVSEPVVAVVSALSGVTDTLIELGRSAQQRAADPEIALTSLYEHHATCCRALNLDPEPILEPLETLSEIIRGVYMLRELTPRSADFIVGHGELLSSRIVSSYLESIEVPSMPVAGWDLGITTDANHGAASVLPMTYDLVPQNMIAYERHIPIVTGFVG
ncbi:MAG: aspartate kinase, partial [Myxococcota bacterium]|nr:aspartate kinase [Myxococcota bacterium]